MILPRDTALVLNGRWLGAILAVSLMVAACGSESNPDGSMNPERAEADALAAANEGRFGLIYTAMLGYVGPSKVVCNAPLRLRREGYLLEAGRYYVSDIPFEDDPAVVQANSDYALRYNAEILKHPDLPYPGVCRLAQHGEFWNIDRRPSEWTRPAFEVAGRPRNLHDAARRGSVPELEQWISQTTEIDALDEFRLAALSWAVLRNRPDHVDTLLNAGAEPFPGYPVVRERTPLWLAVCFGRDDLVGAMESKVESLPELNVPKNCAGPDI